MLASTAIAITFLPTDRDPHYSPDAFGNPFRSCGAKPASRTFWRMGCERRRRIALLSLVSESVVTFQRFGLVESWTARVKLGRPVRAVDWNN